MHNQLTGPSQSYGVYLSHYLSTSHFRTATPTDYALIGGLTFGSALFFSPLWTILTRRLGRTPVMLTGSILMLAGFIAASFARLPGHLYASQGVLVGIGIGALFIPSVQVVPQWFDRQRSLAVGLSSAGSGFGGLAFSLTTDALIRNVSLAWALRVTGIVCFVGNALGTALIRDRNAQVKPDQLGFAVHLLRRYDCLLLLVWAFTNVLGYIVILYSVSSYAVEVVGLTQKQAGALTAMLNLGTGLGRPAAGLVSDRWGRVRVAGCITLACAVVVFAVWMPARSYAVLVFFSLVSGAILGVYWMVSEGSPWVDEMTADETTSSVLALSAPKSLDSKRCLLFFLCSGLLSSFRPLAAKSLHFTCVDQRWVVGDIYTRRSLLGLHMWWQRGSCSNYGVSKDLKSSMREMKWAELANGCIDIGLDVS